MKTVHFLRLLGTLFLAGLPVLSWGALTSGEAIVRLLNSPNACSPKAYEEAAAKVAQDAQKNTTVSKFVLALISRERNPPPSAQISEKLRTQYLTQARAKIAQIANENGNPMALYLLSLDTNDPELLRRAAEGGNVQAQNAWGLQLLSRALTHSSMPSNQVETTLQEAYRYFARAAAQKDPNGCYNQGRCKQRALGTKQDDVGAFYAFRTAAEKGHPEAMNDLGAFFREGRVVARDYSLAMRLFAKSASYGNPFGQFNYALALRRGEGVSQDFGKAFPFLECAAEGGCVEAMNVLGVACWRGEGTVKDSARAVKCFLRAADALYPPAMDNLSTCFEQGVGVDVDEKRALEWKMRSRALRGDAAARTWLQNQK